MSLPFLRLSGSPFEQGVAHGRELRRRVVHNRMIYFERFARETGLSEADVLRIAVPYAEAITAQNPNYYAGMKGIAQGSGLSFGEIAALNLRYEILYYQFGKLAAAASAEPPIDGCTAFAVLPAGTVSGHLLIGQNWDWIPEIQGAVVATQDDDGWETLGYTEAGIFGTKIGLNSVGVGLAINGMTTTDDDLSRHAKPFHVRCYEILRSRSFESAVEVVIGESRCCSTNFLIAQSPDKVVDIEAAPDEANLITCVDNCLTHANHFVDPSGLGIVEPPNDRRVYSRHRSDRLRDLLAAHMPLTIEVIKGYLRDTKDDPFGICRHRDLSSPPEQHYTTVTSVILNLETRTIHLTDGPPDESSYETFQLTE